MSEKKAMFLINIFKNIINVYFDTFFVFYFFKVANYEVLPLAKYYLTLYLSCALGFFLVRNVMKKNIKVPYFRIGISLQAIYIAMIMLLKENLVQFVYLVGFVKGIADGFFHFPKNILETEKISNIDRQQYSGKITTINKISSIVVPLILGVSLTYISYTDLGKIFFILFIIIFVISFFIDDTYHLLEKKFETKKFINLVKTNKDIKSSLFICLLAGFTYSSGVMATIVNLTKINIFKTNLNLGYVDSICGVIFLLSSLYYTHILKRKDFKKVANISGITSFIILVIYAFKPSVVILILYLLSRNSCIGLINLITNNTVNNLSNSNELKENFKAEYYFARDLMLSISRCIGYMLLLIVCLVFGMEYINYILIIAACALLIEGILVGKLCKNEVK